MPPPFAATRTLPDVLALLDTDFIELATGVAGGGYAIWLGSGISFDQMPQLLDLPEIVLEHLRLRMNLAGPCPYRDSLTRILALTPLSDAEKASIDYAQPVSTWTQLDLIRRSLVRDYARMMDQSPAGQAPDYLLWDGVEVVRRYADPTVAPGVEHLALAALIVEGVAPDIASGNWDGLVEAAVTQIASDQPGILQVRVLEAEYRLGAAARARLYKFHGCAVLARQNQAAYRGSLIGRQSQLDAWAAEHPVAEAQLVRMAVNQPTLMLGFSAQDFNIRNVFIRARVQMTWPFPNHPPAFVFSEDHIGPDQQAVLRNQYPTVYDDRQEQIDAASLLRAYAAHLLPALWLCVVEIKLGALAAVAAPDLAPDDHAALKVGLKALRDHAAAACDGLERKSFVDGALAHLGRALALAREGQLTAAGGAAYAPITTGPSSEIATDHNLTASGLPQVALAAAVLGYGDAIGAWTCGVTFPVVPTAGAMRLEGGRRGVEVFFAANERAAARLVSKGHVDTGDEVVLIHSEPITAPAARSSGRTFGRLPPGLRVREVSVRSMIDSGADLASLVQHCQLEFQL
jgi:hypothetical protein